MRARWITALLVGVTLAAAACTTTTVGSGDTPTTQPADQAAPGTSEAGSGDYHDLLHLAVTDIQDYWSNRFPAVYGQPYQPIPDSRLYPATATALPPACGPSPMTYDDVQENAFYCRPGDYVTWGDDQFFPALYQNYGAFTIALVLAHEWGHAVQARAGVQAPSVVTELQADCFAGSWTSYVASGDSPYLELDATAFDQALAGMLAFRDAPGSDPRGDTAHGSAFDRVNAFQEGFEQGPDYCATYVANPPPVFELPFDSEADYQSGGNAPLEDALTFSANDLNSYWGSLSDKFTPVDALQAIDVNGDLPTCGSHQYTADEVRSAVFFCSADNYVGFDTALIQQVYGETGDFGVATVLATQWGVSAQEQAGVTSDDDNTVAQRACFIGSWASVAAQGGSSFTLSPGDLDEAIAAILAFSKPASADSSAVSGAFGQVESFRDGFFNGASRCLQYVN